MALIAEDMLTPQAKAAAKELLDGANISDAEVVNWADEIRRERRDKASWHYVTIPDDTDHFDRARDGRDGDNIIDAIMRETKVLADTTQLREKRVEALSSLFTSLRISTSRCTARTTTATGAATGGWCCPRPRCTGFGT